MRPSPETDAKERELEAQLDDEKAKVRGLRAELGMARAELAASKAAREAAQAKIDALMLEYCPDEMTQEQTNRWAAAAIKKGLI